MSLNSRLPLLLYSKSYFPVEVVLFRTVFIFGSNEAITKEAATFKETIIISVASLTRLINYLLLLFKQ